MMKSKDTKVQNFIDETMMLDNNKHQILQALRKITLENYPEAEERMMYGGIIFSLEEDFGGVFVYKNHLSYEFSNGFKFEDPEKLLEGNGKFRRHLKLKSMDDLEMKKVDFFVKQTQLID